jgi:protein KRI1
MIAGGTIKTRFKYKKVTPNAYGLRIDQILLTDDKDLAQLVSLKLMAPSKDQELTADTKREESDQDAGANQIVAAQGGRAARPAAGGGRGREQGEGGRRGGQELSCVADLWSGGMWTASWTAWPDSNRWVQEREELCL